MNFSKKYDVVVAGGGIAGVAAAIAAARRGMKTALVEKTVWFGGLATTGMVYIYLPLCDGNGTQVTFGLAENLLKAGIKYGPGDIPQGWSSDRNAPEERRYRVIFSPSSMVLAMDEMLEDAGVDIWLDTVIYGARTENGRVTALQVVNKSGTGLLEAGCVVDASGDADVAHFAGHACPVADNALAMWAIEYCHGKPYHLGDNVHMRINGTCTDTEMNRQGIDGRLVSDFVMNGRRKYRKLLDEQYASGQYDRKTLFPLALPGMAQFRHTRRIDGLYTLTDNMDWQNFEDSVGIVADWRKPGYVWEIPYRSLLPRGLKGVVAAGRCISAEKDAWEVTRVIPVAALTGEVAGVAAAMSIKADTTPDELPYAALSRELRDKCGFPLHFADLGLTGK